MENEKPLNTVIEKLKSLNWKGRAALAFVVMLIALLVSVPRESGPKKEQAPTDTLALKRIETALSQSNDKASFGAAATEPLISLAHRVHDLPRDGQRRARAVSLLARIQKRMNEAPEVGELRKLLAEEGKGAR